MNSIAASTSAATTNHIIASTQTTNEKSKNQHHHNSTNTTTAYLDGENYEALHGEHLGSMERRLLLCSESSVKVLQKQYRITTRYREYHITTTPARQQQRGDRKEAVSYTHLTLPTKA